MFESDNPTNYEKVFAELVPRLAAADLAGNAGRLGLAWEDGHAVAPCLGRDYWVGPQGVTLAGGGQAPLNHRIVLAYYLLHGGQGENAGRWTPYRELPGGQDFARSLSVLVEEPMAKAFAGRVEELRAAAVSLGGEPDPDFSSADAAFAVPALPRLPLMFTFYDADEEFPAEAKVFYDLTAPNFLDLECLAVLPLLMVQELQAAARA